MTRFASIPAPAFEPAAPPGRLSLHAIGSMKTWLHSGDGCYAPDLHEFALLSSLLGSLAVSTAFEGPPTCASNSDGTKTYPAPDRPQDRPERVNPSSIQAAQTYSAPSSQRLQPGLQPAQLEQRLLNEMDSFKYDSSQSGAAEQRTPDVHRIPTSVVNVRGRS